MNIAAGNALSIPPQFSLGSYGRGVVETCEYDQQDDKGGGGGVEGV